MDFSAANAFLGSESIEGTGRDEVQGLPRWYGAALRLTDEMSDESSGVILQIRTAGVKRRSCRSTQVNKTQVKSCGSKVAAMGTLAVGFLPFAQG